MKIHIVGGAGSGKSYMAQQISKHFAIPHYDLDNLFWDNHANEYGIKASETERDEALQAIVSQSEWIIEGVYIGWLDISFRSADKIFVLTPPVSVQEERIWKRYEDRKRGIIESKQETYESVVKLIEWNKTYNAQSLPSFIDNSEYKEKMIVLDSNDGIFHHLL